MQQFLVFSCSRQVVHPNLIVALGFDHLIDEAVEGVSYELSILEKFELDSSVVFNTDTDAYRSWLGLGALNSEAYLVVVIIFVELNPFRDE